MIIPFFPSLIPLLFCPEKLSFIFLDYMNLHIYGCVYTKGWHMYLFVLYTHASMYLWANIKSSLIPGLGRSTGEGIGYPLQYSWASLADQLVKNPPAMQETWVWSLGWEDPLEKGKATHSSILAGEFVDHIVHGVTKSRTWLSDFHFHFFFIKSSDSKIHGSIVKILKKN